MGGRIVYIYGLTDFNGDIRYIGQSVNPRLRYMQHLVDSADTPKTRWIRELLSKGYKPGLVILEKVELQQANFTETWWIALGRKRGWELTNVSYPTRNNPDFGDLFRQQLKEEFEQFRLNHDPVLFISRAQMQRCVYALRLGLAASIAVAHGWSIYFFEMSFSGSWGSALFHGFTACMITCYTSFFWAVSKFDSSPKLWVMCVLLLLPITFSFVNWLIR